MLSEASRLLLKLKSTDEYCYILFSAFNKFAEEPIFMASIKEASLEIFRRNNLYYELATITIRRQIAVKTTRKTDLLMNDKYSSF